MNTKGKKILRFEDWNPESSFSLENTYSTDDGYHLRKGRPRVKSVFKSIKRKLQRRYEKLKNLGKPIDVLPVSDGTPEKLIQKWNKIFEITCLMAVSVDPLFFYILVIDAKGKCLNLDRPLQITASVLRTIFDLFYILCIMFQSRTRFIAPSSRVFGRGELIIDILSIIPLPQVIVLAIIPSMVSNPSVAKDWLKYIILVQYVPRFLRIYPLFRQVTRTSGMLTETAWASAAYNLFLYMLSSHIVGSFWYLFSVESQLRCWHQELKRADLSAHTYLSCWQHNSITVFSILNGSCPLIDPDDIKDPVEFNFGMSIDALKSHVVQSTTDFPRKIFYCFWWGLRNVSSLGQNLKTSTYVGEIIFAVFIAISGLVLFALLIGNMQVPLFEKMDEWLLDALCDRVKPILYTNKSHIIRKGDPVDEMLFIMRGELASMTTDGVRTGFFNSIVIKAGDFCGEELLTWAMDPNSSSNLPISKRTVESISEVEALALMAEDLKFVAAQFCCHNRHSQHIFRFYSPEWRKWASCFIQAAWRRYHRKKSEKSLCEAEERQQDDALSIEEGSSSSFAATIYASRFAARALRNLRNKGEHNNRMPQRLLPLMPQKPTEPDFTSQIL